MLVVILLQIKNSNQVKQLTTHGRTIVILFVCDPHFVANVFLQNQGYVDYGQQPIYQQPSSLNAGWFSNDQAMVNNMMPGLIAQCFQCLENRFLGPHCYIMFGLL